MENTQDLEEYQQIVRNLLKIIRNKRSQAQMSRMLSFSQNRYHRYESGSLNIKWSDFYYICDTLKIDLKESFELFIENYNNSGSSILKQIHKRHCRYSTLEEVSKNLNIPIHKLKRIHNDQQEPTVVFILHYIDKTTAIFDKLLSHIHYQISPLYPYKSQTKRQTKYKTLQEIIKNTPESLDLISVINTDTYKSKKWDLNTICSLIDSDTTIISKAIKELTKNNIITEKKGLYEVLPQETSHDIKISQEVLKQLISNILSKKNDQKNLYSIKYIATSKKTELDIRRVLDKAMAEIDNLVQSDSSQKDCLIKIAQIITKNDTEEKI